MNRILMETIFKNPYQSEEREKIDLELELKRRKISAKLFSRILPDTKPEYMGNFNTNIYSDGEEPLGFFEMFIKNNKDGVFDGTIEDCDGTARVEGKLLPDKINFTKRYIKGKSSITVPEVNIKYEGYFNKNKNYYVGEWYVENNTEESHKFCLSAKPFS